MDALPPDVPSFRTALLVEAATGWVPYANDVPLTIGVGVRFLDVHELWVRGGYFPRGDDQWRGVGVGGYRVVFRPRRVVRPTIGAMVAGVSATCSHDSTGAPVCTDSPLFIFAATGGVRIEPAPWIGFSAIISFGTDSYPNPFGMVELAVTFALPLK